MPLLSSILNVSLLVTLVLALGLSGAAFGLFAHNNILGVCVLDITTDIETGNHKLCNASLAGYILASICIAVVTMMEFNKLVYGKTANIAGKILQIILLSVSIVFLLISGISVTVGWAKTCKTIKNTSGLSCSDKENPFLIVVNNQEMIGSALLNCHSYICIANSLENSLPELPRGFLGHCWYVPSLA
ncbi:PREDICTED: uncharacterized protein LOC109582585 isoform X2 [Amphimedon queenslandica]|uniref:Uncharacterized protein n=1 Tax=Amphimedon queenslandica TaxID=400682 RepID=A0AAN0J832_AMPQE|nr:PREDICTED: uncharacterized protein LOC109582585 isoform X2 [Amphimedon queenslandica]|eukprot:XP_019852917.1 PREDICTED: uncharacterized protein LOC109582585 isoform X2 [Amphimedon queenslandica]